MSNKHQELRFGLPEATIEKICTVLAKHQRIEKAVIYGSRAKGNYKPGSDIDLTLYGQNLTLDDLATVIDELDDLLLPYSIDLSLFDELNNAKLREHIERVGLVFYERENAGGMMKAGWQTKKLGELIKLEYGKPLPDEKRKAGGKYPVYGANGEKDRTDEFYFDKPSIIVGRKGSAGEINLTEKEFWPLDVTYFVKFDEKELHLKFLYSLLATLDLPKLAKGVKPGINRNEVYSIDVKIPSTPEQQIIVAILDEAFEGIATAAANAKKNLNNARELFDSYLQSVFEDKTFGSKFETLDCLCELIVDCEHKTAPTQETGYPSIRTTNIGKGILILDGVNRVSEQTYNEWTRRAIPQADDLILAREAPAGNIAVIPENIKVCLGQRTVLIRPKKDRLFSKFLAYLILSKDVQKQLLSHSIGATVEHINMKDIRAFRIFNLSPLSEQRSIVHKLDALSAETKKLEAIYQQKLLALDELKKSILNKAFSGQLHIKARAAA